MLEAVREGLLTRMKINAGGKQVWAYKTDKAA
jgi:hypothetical protein